MTLDVQLDTALLEEPVHTQHGDLAFPCFQLSKELRKAPPQIAQDIADAVQNILSESGAAADADKTLESSAISEVLVIGAYINFRASEQWCVDNVL